MTSKVTVSALVDLLGSVGVEPSPELFDKMCRERGIHPAFSVAYAARGLDGVRDLGLALWVASGEAGRD